MNTVIAAALELSSVAVLAQGTVTTSVGAFEAIDAAVASRAARDYDQIVRDADELGCEGRGLASAMASRVARDYNQIPRDELDDRDASTADLIELADLPAALSHPSHVGGDRTNVANVPSERY